MLALLTLNQDLIVSRTVPQFSAVLADGGQDPAIRREGCIANPALMPAKRRHDLLAELAMQPCSSHAPFVFDEFRRLSHRLDLHQLNNPRL